MPTIRKMVVENTETTEKQPVFPIYNSPLDLMNQSQTANTADNTKIQFNVVTSSVDTWVDANVHLTLSGLFRLDVKVEGTVTEANKAILTAGLTFATREFFAHRLVQTSNVKLNEHTLTAELADELNELISLSSSPALRKYSTSGYRLPVYANMSDAGNTVSSTYQGLSSTGGTSESLGVGSYVNFQFCDPNGNVLSGGVSTTGEAISSYASAVGAKATNNADPAAAVDDVVKYVNGVPVTATTAHYNTQVYDIYIKVTVTERLLMEPFGGSSISEEMGFKGLKNLNIQLNLKPDLSGCFAFPKGDSNNQRRLNAKPILVGNKWTEARLDYITRTAPITAKIEKFNVKPYYYIVRQNQVYTSPNIPAQGTKQFRLGAFPLSQVFEYMYITCKKSSYNYISATPENDYFLPISNVSIDFDGSPSILSTLTKEQLYHMSTKNGIEVPYPVWSGQAFQGANTANADMPPQVVQTYGGGILIHAKDLAMASGVGAGVSGRFVINPSVTVENIKTAAMNDDINVQIMYFNRGFLVNANGRTTALLDVLNSQDLLDSPSLPEVLDAEDLNMMYGGSFFSKLKSGLSKVGRFLMKPEVRQAVKAGVNVAAQSGNPRARAAAENMNAAMQIAGYGQAGGQVYSGGVATGGARRARRSKKVPLHSLTSDY